VKSTGCHRYSKETLAFDFSTFQLNACRLVEDGCAASLYHCCEGLEYSGGDTSTSVSVSSSQSRKRLTKHDHHLATKSQFTFNVTQVRAITILLAKWRLLGYINIDCTGSVAKPSFEETLIRPDGKCVVSSVRHVGQKLPSSNPVACVASTQSHSNIHVEFC
jgi:hypothetical protein